MKAVSVLLGGDPLLLDLGGTLITEYICRAWPYPEEEKQGKKVNAFLARFGFGQRRKAKGHNFEKVKAQRCISGLLGTLQAP